MNNLGIVASNPIINAAAVAWVCAQFLKLLFSLLLNRKVDWERLMGSGGMPSSHAAFVCAMLVTVGRTQGIDSPFFGLAFCFAAIVLYDAMGVRRAAGEQAKVLNKMIFDFPFFRQARKGTPQEQAPRQSEEEQSVTLIPHHLKELLGHTPFEVLAGCALGVVIALLMPIIQST